MQWAKLAVVALWCWLVSGGAVFTHDGQVMHEVPEFYESDGVTLNPSAAGNKKQLRVIALIPAGGPVGPVMAQSMPMLQPLMRHVNLMTDLLPNYIVELHLLDDQCNSKTAISAFLGLVRRYPSDYFHVVVGPGCSGVCRQVNPVLQPYGFWMVTPISVQPDLSNRINYPNFCRIMEPSQYSAEVVRETLQVFGWSKIAIVMHWESSSGAILEATMEKASSLYAESSGQEGYPFDMEYMRFRTYRIDQSRQALPESKVARLLAQDEVRVAYISMTMDYGAALFCELYKIGYYGKQLQVLESPVTWSNTWVRDGMSALVASGVEVGCTEEEIFQAGKGMFLFNQLAYLESDALHGVTGEVLQDVRERYVTGCSALSEGCQMTYTAMWYDAFALTFKILHEWLEVRGNPLSNVTKNAAELHSIAKTTRFLGVSGDVMMRNGNRPNEDCDRLGTNVIARYESLAGGFETLVSFTDNSGWGGIVPWRPIVWQDGSTTFMGSGSGKPRTAPGQVPSFGDDASGLDNVPADWRVCPEGQTFTARARCEPCPIGTKSTSGGTCASCEPGRFANSSGALECLSCPPGFHVDTSRATKCNACLAGSASAERASTACQICVAGTASPSSGSTACDKCKLGEFQPDMNQSSCVSCSASVLPGGTTKFYGATSPEDCECPLETYWHRPNSEDATQAVCKACEEGLSCWGGNGPPLQKAGFAALKQAFEGAQPHSVVQCSSESACPGETNLGTCPVHRVGTACDICEVGSTKEGEECVPCSETQAQLPLTLAVLGAILLIAIMLCVAMRSHGVKSASMVVLTMMFGITINILQVLTSFKELLLTWPEPVKSLLSVLKIFTFSIELLRPGCVFNLNKPHITYLGSVLGHPVFATVLALLGLAMRTLPIATKFKPTNLQMFNAQGIVVLAVYVGLALIALIPWQCARNPDGTSSVTSYRSTVCWSTEEHQTMIGISIVSILVYVVGVTVGVAFVTMQYPKRIHTPGGGQFIKAFSFVFQRFRPSRYYYGFVLVIRSLSIAIIPVALVNETSLAVLLLFIALVMFGFLQCWLQPWKVPSINVVDASLTVDLLAILVGGALATSGDSRAIETIQMAYIVIIAGMVVVTLGMALWYAYQLLFPRKAYGVFLSHHKAAAGVLARWFKMLLATKTSDAVFLDSDELDRLDKIFPCVAYETKNFVMLLTTEFLQRVWCAGEVASAVRHGINMVGVACQGWTPPTEEFITHMGDCWTEGQKTEVSRLGVEVSHIQAAYRDARFRDLVPIKLDRHVSLAVQGKVIDEVVKQCSELSTHFGKSLTSKFTSATSPKGDVSAPIVIINDATDAEAIVVTGVLSGLLQAQLQVSAAVADPRIAEREGQLKSASFVIANLSRGCLSDPFFAKMLVLSRKQGKIAIVPVISDAMFQIPGPDEWSKFQAGKAGPDLKSDELRGISLSEVFEAYRWTFGVLALRFTALGSERIQSSEVQELAARMRFDRHQPAEDDVAGGQVEVEKANSAQQEAKEESDEDSGFGI